MAHRAILVDVTRCVGCGACVTACPVGAIVPDTALAPPDAVFAGLAVEYFEAFGHADRRPIAPVP